jgi:hypothetical protein
MKRRDGNAHGDQADRFGGGVIWGRFDIHGGRNHCSCYQSCLPALSAGNLSRMTALHGGYLGNREKWQLCSAGDSNGVELQA